MKSVSKKPWLPSQILIHIHPSISSVRYPSHICRSASNKFPEILAPLTSLTKLPNHPTLSRPFTSKALTELVAQGRDLMHKENAALWKVRPLLTRLQGDHTWAPCGMMTEPSNFDLFSEDYVPRFHGRPAQASTVRSTGTPTISGGPAEDGATGNGEASKPAENKNSPNNQEPAPTEGGPDESQDPDNVSSDKPAGPVSEEQSKSTVLDATNREKDESEAQTNGQTSNETNNENERRPSRAGQTTTAAAAAVTEAQEADVEMAEAPEAEAGTGKPSNPGSYHSGSRALSMNPDMTDDLFIHPLFLAPRSALPARDQGLPEPEADDVRRLLQLYVQKQEEVCRGTTNLYMGLLKADRCRKTVLKWSKAEAHCGDRRDMSDGEDWYDKEEWGLVEDLKKGQDEEEEDTAQTQKKTRNRR